MVDYNLLLSEVEESKSFILPDGSKIRSLSALVESFRKMNNSVFKNHVNENKNDFANWILHCFNDELLSQRLYGLKTKDEIRDEIESRLGQAKIAIALKRIDGTTEKSGIKEPQINSPIIEPNLKHDSVAVPVKEVNSKEQPAEEKIEDILGFDGDLDINTPVTPITVQTAQKSNVDLNLNLDSDLSSVSGPSIPAQQIVKPKLESTLEPVNLGVDIKKEEAPKNENIQEKAVDELLHQKLILNEIKPNIIDKPTEPKIDFLNISIDDLLKIIGVNPENGFIAAMPKDNIMKIKEKKFLKTGVPGFDELVGKGIPHGSAVILSGGPGTGKSTFCIQQLCWAVERGEKCLFISFEKEEKPLEQMKGFGLNTEKHIKTGLLKVKKLDFYGLPSKIESLVSGGKANRESYLTPLIDVIPEGYFPDRVFFDSFSIVKSAFAQKPEEYRIYIEELFNIFSRRGITSFIVTEMEDNDFVSHSGFEDFFADGIVNFYNIKNGGTNHNAMEIIKMKGVSHRKNMVPFDFVSGKGIEVYPSCEFFFKD